MRTVDSVADTLYGLDPAEFVAARKEFVAAARESGDRELTAAIGRLRKPTVAAWMVNLLAREHPHELEALLDLGGELRRAQRTLSAHDLRRLSERRRQAVAQLGRDAAHLASERGRTVTGDALREVAQTLNAAVADPTVAERVRAGRLETIVEPAGFGEGSATSLTVVAPEHAAHGDHGPAERMSMNDTAQRPGSDAVVERATEAAAAAHAAVDEARAAARTADDDLARQEQTVARLRDELDRAEHQLRFARRAAASAKREITNAERTASAADAALARLRAD
ncbi:MAG: hypothetical protein GXY65_17625 [Rhodococcus sp.]|uniref:hypothetical protein n=1 Tax=Rhodococcus TaxID=1827 RepID=UPI00169320A0|nr:MULTISPECIES: hypothetical protein [Rhodococcus]NLV81120.1 hypothetical protein [Rhodococcus sp. (in: high G+C Gram-positive bacteria)]